MSSPFQQKFSAKSPLNGNYYSGVDGLQYVSPKIPESKTPADTSSKTKTPETIIPPTETPETTTTREQVKPIPIEKAGIEIQNFMPTVDLPKYEDVSRTKKRTLEAEVPGKKAKSNEEYLESFKPGFARDNLGFNNITDYRKFKEKENNERSKQKVLTDQEQIQTGIQDKETGEIIWNPRTGDWVDTQNN